MKRKSSVSFGPGASSLILIFVVLAMSVLGMLSLMNSRNDMRLSERSVQVTEAVYALNVQAEEKRAQVEQLLESLRQSVKTDEEYLEKISQSLPDGMTLKDGALTWAESDGFRHLSLALRVLPLEEGGRTQWSRYRLTAETTEEEWEEEW